MKNANIELSLYYEQDELNTQGDFEDYDDIMWEHFRPSYTYYPEHPLVKALPHLPRKEETMYLGQVIEICNHEVDTDLGEYVLQCTTFRVVDVEHGISPQNVHSRDRDNPLYEATLNLKALRWSLNKTQNLSIN